MVDLRPRRRRLAEEVDAAEDTASPVPNTPAKLVDTVTGTRLQPASSGQ